MNPKLFIPPINKHLRFVKKNESHLCSDDMITNLLTLLLNKVDTNDCTNYFAEVVLRRKRIGGFLSASAHPHKNMSEIEKRSREVNWILNVCQALFAYAKLGAYACELMLENGILLLLHNLREENMDNLKIQAYIGTILEILSEHNFSHEAFLTTGWIGILVQWLSCNHLELSLPAIKILNNLDHYNYHTFLKSIYLLHPVYRNQSHDYDVIFIHGLLGNIFRTWRQNDKCKQASDYTWSWPISWLAKEMQEMRILAVDYFTYLSDWNVKCPPEKQTIEQRSQHILDNLIAAGVGEKAIVFVGHSMGGLLIKQMLILCSKSSRHELQNICKQTKGVVFYCVPHFGSDISNWTVKFDRIIFPSQEVRDLMKDSQLLRNLNDEFLSLMGEKKIECLAFGETQRTKINFRKVKFETMMVPKESAKLPIGQHYWLANTDHFQACKPENTSSDSYLITKRFISQIVNKFSKE